MAILPTQRSTFGASGATVTTTINSGIANRVKVSDRWFFTLGDSRTAFHDEQYGHWQDPLADALRSTPGGIWSYTNRGAGSQTVNSYRVNYVDGGSVFSAPINGAGDGPAAVLFNLGLNDSFIGPLPTQANWQTDYLDMIDVCRTHWANCPIYIMRWWGRGLDTDADTMNSWVPAMIALRTGVYLGPDERVFLKGSDNGVTNTYDGIHQNAAGMAATSAAWATVLNT